MNFRPLPIELWMERDHQRHVNEYRRHLLRLAVKGSPRPATTPVTDDELNRRYGFAKPYRNPTPQEDPHAYTVGF